LHYRGWLRVARRDAGVRVYALPSAVPARLTRDERRTRVDALVDAVVNVYAPLPAVSLSALMRRLRYAAPQWPDEMGAALQRAKSRLARSSADGVEWFWPNDERADGHDVDDTVRLLAPFDPVVWDRRRFEVLWGWAYRCEAYTPAAKRQRGDYALPMLWRDRAIGWANVTLDRGALRADIGYVDRRPPRERGFNAALDAELDRMSTFLQARLPAARRPPVRRAAP